MNATDQPSRPASTKPVIVLVHGAFADEGSHVIMISQPQAVAEVITKAAGAAVAAHG